MPYIKLMDISVTALVALVISVSGIVFVTAEKVVNADNTASRVTKTEKNDASMERRLVKLESDYNITQYKLTTIQKTSDRVETKLDKLLVNWDTINSE